MKKVVIPACFIAVLLVGCTVFPGMAAAATGQPAHTIHPVSSDTIFDPAASSVELLSISYWRNGIRQPDIPMKGKFCETLFISFGDYVMLKPNGLYKGPRGTKAYMVLWEPPYFSGQAVQYKWMKPGVTTSMQVAKPYCFGDYGDYVFWFDLYLPGEHFGDSNLLKITVV